jgi:hypothetical protein
VPSQQSLFGQRVLCIEIAQSLEGNYSHDRIIVPFWDYVSVFQRCKNKR